MTATALARCAHCGSAVMAGAGGGALVFCCPGCRGAHELLTGLGLDGYYRRRSLDPNLAPLRPEAEEVAVDWSAYVQHGADGRRLLHLMVEGLQCAACVWLIESLLARQPGVVEARLNMTTRRLRLVWEGEAEAQAILGPVLAVGYRLAPFDPARLNQDQRRRETELLRAMAVAGFAAGNVMLFSVSIWAGQASDMDWATLSLFHWLSGLIALPAMVYCVRPFARSAFQALAAGRSNMDVPITVAVILTGSISLFETIEGGQHAYFDAAISLLFFLLVGRYLDARARGQARSAAEHLLSLLSCAVTVLKDGTRRLMAPERVRPGMVVLVAAGERIGVDGTVEDGSSDVDVSLITGESLPQPVGPGSMAFAGTLNLSAPLRLRAARTGEATLLADIVRMMEAAEQGRARYVVIADRVARAYTPVVHLLALATFLGWTGLAGAPWAQALLISASVLIITCPCALALAVPVVQVAASARLLKSGILLKSATAQERLADVDTIVFDKTGTLTLGRPELVADRDHDAAALRLAAGLALASRHPLARALARAVPGAVAADGVREVPGCGLEWNEVRLGSRRWLGLADDGADARPELFLLSPGQAPVRFVFQDTPKADAGPVLAALKARGYDLAILSGDRSQSVAAVAGALGIARFEGDLDPAAKVERLAALGAAGRRVLMVGDGLNDAPALAAAHVSASPSSAIDISQNAADVVFQGDRLAPLGELLGVTRQAATLVRQNILLSLVYNLIAVPFAILGHVTPLFAAIAMSTSSLLVIANALRLSKGWR